MGRLLLCSDLVWYGIQFWIFFCECESFRHLGNIGLKKKKKKEYINVFVSREQMLESFCKIALAAWELWELMDSSAGD